MHNQKLFHLYHFTLNINKNVFKCEVILGRKETTTKYTHIYIPLYHMTTSDSHPFHDSEAVSQALHLMQHPGNYHQTLFVAFWCKQIPTIIKRD